MEEEIWRDIEGYEGKYQVSNLGRVKSLNYNRKGIEKILAVDENNKGYCQIKLCKNGIVKKHFIHRLVAIAFIPNVENKSEVNHKDQNPKNNNVDNLEWVTPYENSIYEPTRKLKSTIAKNRFKNKEEILKASERTKKVWTNEEYRKSHIRQVIQYSIEGKIIKVWDSVSKASEELNIFQSSIRFCICGRYKTAGGYKWKYKEKGVA